MCTKDSSNLPGQVHPLAIAIAIIVLVCTAYYFWNHDPMLALPSPPGPKVSGDEAAMRLASADVTKEAIGYLTSLAIALAAAVAFFVKDGLGSCTWIRSGNLVLTTLVAFFIIKSLLHGYDSYGMLAIQLSEGHFLISRVQQVIAVQAQSLVIALGFTIFLISARCS